MNRAIFILLLILLWPPGEGFGVVRERLRVAVASNFAYPLKQISRSFLKQTGITIQISQGSSGKLFSQIVNGAPYDIFLSADSIRPQKLEKVGVAEKKSRFTFAKGVLALWSSKGEGPQKLMSRLREGKLNKLALANPKLAPFGEAAEKYLKSIGVWEILRRKMVFGENIGQTFYFTKSGNADLGLVALSQLKQRKVSPAHYKAISPGTGFEILQEGVILQQSKEARQFVAFLQSPKIKQLIQSMGHEVPE
jgi:molybdate transport system substrate-binding protein